MDFDAWAVERLTAAIVQVVRHPSLDLTLVQTPAELLRERYDQQLSKQLIALVVSAKESPATKGRAVEVMGLLDDPNMIDPLIKLLPSKAGPVAAAALKQITGQNLGANPAAWKTWWHENQPAARRGYEARQTERTAGLKVGVPRDGKTYHKLDCPLLNQAAVSKEWTMKEVRTAGWQPCPTCKPLK
jgi:hypothetical protein